MRYIHKQYLPSCKSVLGPRADITQNFQQEFSILMHGTNEDGGQSQVSGDQQGTGPPSLSPQA